MTGISGYCGHERGFNLMTCKESMSWEGLVPTVARTPAAWSPPMTLMRALGHMNRKLGL